MSQSSEDSIDETRTTEPVISSRKAALTGAVLALVLGIVFGGVLFLGFSVSPLPTRLPSVYFFLFELLFFGGLSAITGAFFGMIFVKVKKWLPTQSMIIKGAIFQFIVAFSSIIALLILFVVNRNFVPRTVPTTTPRPPAEVLGAIFAGATLLWFSWGPALGFILKRWSKNATVFEPRLTGGRFRASMLIVVLMISFGSGIFVSLVEYLLGNIPLGLAPGMLRELASLIALLPLYAWYVWRGSSRALRGVMDESKKTLVLLPLLLVAFAFLYSEVSIIFAVILTIVLVESYSPSSFGFRFQRAARLLGLGVLLLTAYFLPIVLAFGVRYGSALSSIFSFIGFDFASLPLTLLYAIFIIGVAEEGLYRGYVQTKLVRIFGFRKATVLQAVLLAAWHFNSRFALEDQVFRLTEVFFFGLLAGVYYWQTRSLIGVAFFHGMWDTFVFNVKGFPVILFHIPIPAMLEDLMTGKLFILLSNLSNDLPFQVGFLSIVTIAIMCFLARRICSSLGVLSNGTSRG